MRCWSGDRTDDDRPGGGSVAVVVLKGEPEQKRRAATLFVGGAGEMSMACGEGGSAAAAPYKCKPSCSSQQLSCSEAADEDDEAALEMFLLSAGWGV